MNISSLPYFRGLLRAVEARVYEDLELPSPSLDLGCGDGHFSRIAFNEEVSVGLDPWAGPVRIAAREGKYKQVIQGTGDRIPFSKEYFSSAVSNSVLEHIPDLDPVFQELSRVLKPGAPFIFCVPNENFLLNLSVSNWLDKVGLHKFADKYRAFFNRISRHHHCDPRNVWEERLEKHGFFIEDHVGLFFTAEPGNTGVGALPGFTLAGLPFSFQEMDTRSKAMEPLAHFEDRSTRVYRTAPAREGILCFLPGEKKVKKAVG